MIFRVHSGRFNTDDMVSLDVERPYLRLYLHEITQQLFLQTFDQERGINISPINLLDAQQLLERAGSSDSPDNLTFQTAFSKLVKDIATHQVL